MENQYAMKDFTGFSCSPFLDPETAVPNKFHSLPSWSTSIPSFTPAVNSRILPSHVFALKATMYSSLIPATSRFVPLNSS